MSERTDDDAEGGVATQIERWATALADDIPPWRPDAAVLAGGPARPPRRPRRGAVLLVAAAVLVLTAVGALVVATDDPPEDGVVTDGGTRERSTPPPEQPVGTFRLDADGTFRLDAHVVAVEPGIGFTVSASDSGGPAEGGSFTVSRPRSLAWERWDGERWTARHTLVPARGAEPPEILPAGATPPPEGEAEPDDPETGTDRFVAPDDPPGWYRVCRSLAGTTVTWNETATTVLQEGTACAQVRVPDEELRATMGFPVRPPAEPTDGPVQVTHRGHAPGEIARLDGGLFLLTFTADDPQGWVRAGASTWEIWDGEQWNPIHTFVPAEPTEPGAEPSIRPFDGDADAPEADLPATGDALYALPSLIRPGWYRLCTDAHEATDGPFVRLARPCAQVLVPLSAWSEDGMPPVTTESGTATAETATTPPG